MGIFGVQNHGQIGKKFLESCGVPYPIPDLVLNHVNAKRYLVSKHKEYFEKLSPASVETLKHQGRKLISLYQSCTRARAWKDRVKLRPHHMKKPIIS